MWIMIAGPYRGNSNGQDEWKKNLEILNRAALAVFKKGHTPLIGVNMAMPLVQIAGEASYEELMKPISLQLAERCDAVLRIGGESPGADHEVDMISSKGGRVFKSVEEIPEVPKRTR